MQFQEQSQCFPFGMICSVFFVSTVLSFSSFHGKEEKAQPLSRIFSLSPGQAQPTPINNNNKYGQMGVDGGSKRRACTRETKVRLNGWCEGGHGQLRNGR